MIGIDSRELEELREFKEDTLDHVEDVAQLLNYSDDMRIVTGYKCGDKPNLQAIRNWIIRVRNQRSKEC